MPQDCQHYSPDSIHGGQSHWRKQQMPSCRIGPQFRATPTPLDPAMRKEEEASLVMVTPLWETQSWFSMIMALCIDHPRILPHGRDLLLPTGNTGAPDPRPNTASRSGDILKVEEFHRKLESSSRQHGENLLTRATNRRGIISATQRVWIQFQPLEGHTILPPPRP